MYAESADARATTEPHHTHRAKGLAAGGVPDLDLDAVAVIEGESVGAKLNADCRVGVGKEAVIGEAEEQRRFSHTGVSHNDKLGEIVPLAARHVDSGGRERGWWG